MAHIRLKALVASAALVLSTASGWAEANKLRVAKQYGLGYMQFMVMEDQKLDREERQGGRPRRRHRRLGAPSARAT